ncbi:NAD-specific glutamate dehydrogenase [compost metagenome]
MALGTRVQVRRQSGLLNDPAGNRVIEVIATQSAIATGGQYFKDTAGQAQDRDIEGATTQIVNRNQAFGVLVQAIGHRCRSRLIEQSQHIQARQARSVLGGLTLSIVEIRRNRDHRTDQFPAQGFFCTLAQDLENIRRDFHRAFRPLNGVDERHMRLTADKAVRQLLTQLLDVRQATTHQALDRQHGIERVAGSGVTRHLTDIDVVSVIAHCRRQDDPALGVRQGLATAAAQGGNQGVGGTKVNTHRQTTLVRLGALTGFGDLQ